MQPQTTRATIYLDTEMHKALRLKAAETHRSISDIVSEAVREALREDEQDLAAIAARAGEKTISYEQLLAELKANGRI
jgi:plasmid stability protein